MKLVYSAEHPYISTPSWSLKQVARRAIVVGIRALILAFAIIGVLNVAPFEASTAAGVERETTFDQARVYFPGQFVNTAKQREQWIEQF